jgi:hypothetical protein
MDPQAHPRAIHDSHAVKANSVKYHTPLPRVEDVIAPAIKAKSRGINDVVSAFSRPFVFENETAIKTLWGLYEWVPVMPQGL